MIQPIIIRVSQADDSSPVIATTVTLPLPMQQAVLTGPSAGQAGAGRTAGEAVTAFAATLGLGGPTPTPVAPLPAAGIAGVTTAPDGSTTAT